MALTVTSACRYESRDAKEDPPVPPATACPDYRREAPVPAGVQIVASRIHLLQTGPELSWETADGRLVALRAHASLSEVSPSVLGSTWDERYWYRLRCEDCSARGPIGRPTAIERIDKVTHEVIRLGTGSQGMTSLLSYGDYVYWGARPHGLGGGIYRASKATGEQERIRIWPDGADRPVQQLLPLDSGIAVMGENFVGWIPADGSQPEYVYESRGEISAVVFDGRYCYVADTTSDKTGGYIHRIQLTSLDQNVLLRSPDAPAALSVRAGQLYYMFVHSDDVWSIPILGGQARIAVNGSEHLLMDPLVSVA